MSAGMTAGSAPNVNGTGMYQPFNDRPGKCDGCGKEDYPSISGPSAIQLGWNPPLGKWLCADCRHGYSEWQSRVYHDQNDMWESRPTFMRDNKISRQDEETIIRGRE